VRYNPCLACLGGVGAVRAEKVLRGQHQVAASNVDGAVRDEDVFIVGDEDEDEASEMHDGQAAKTPGGIQPPSEVVKPLTPDISVKPSADPNQSDSTGPDSDQGSPGRYFIRPDDTLLGISLRLGIDVSAYLRVFPLRSELSIAYQGRTLCKLNDLPPSTLRTTPHLLHTRTFLVLPQSHPQQHANDTNDVSPEKEAQRERARAQVAFQRVTKETDDGVAQAYVALAAEDSESGSDVIPLKAEGEKAVSRRVVGRTIEERAVDRYLDDDEWERRERAEGRGVHIQRLPIGRPRGEKVEKVVRL
jgi:hypothetical protein